MLAGLNYIYLLSINIWILIELTNPVDDIYLVLVMGWLWIGTKQSPIIYYTVAAGVPGEIIY